MPTRVLGNDYFFCKVLLNKKIITGGKDLIFNEIITLAQ